MFWIRIRNFSRAFGSGLVKYPIIKENIPLKTLKQIYHRRHIRTFSILFTWAGTSHPLLGQNHRVPLHDPNQTTEGDPRILNMEHLQYIHSIQS